MDTTTNATTPPSNTYSLGTLLALINQQTGWYAEEHPDEQNTVNIHAYRHHHPPNTGVERFQPTDDSTSLTAQFNPEKNTVEFNAGHFVDDRTTQFKEPELTDTLQTVLEEKATRIKNVRFRRFRINARATRSLKSAYDNYYTVLKKSHRQLTEIDQIGESRADQILAKRPYQHNLANWAFFTYCPNCDEQFWSAHKHTNDDNEPTTDTSPDISDITHKTYCPSCQHYPIPESHILDPVEFTNDNVYAINALNDDTDGKTLLDY